MGGRRCTIKIKRQCPRNLPQSRKVGWKRLQLRQRRAKQKTQVGQRKRIGHNSNNETNRMEIQPLFKTYNRMASIQVEKRNESMELNFFQNISYSRMVSIHVEQRNESGNDETFSEASTKSMVCLSKKDYKVGALNKL